MIAHTLFRDDFETMNETELLESGIKPNTIRLSIGTEHIDDIIYDLSQAFES